MILGHFSLKTFSKSGSIWFVSSNLRYLISKALAIFSIEGFVSPQFGWVPKYLPSLNVFGVSQIASCPLLLINIAEADDGPIERAKVRRAEEARVRRRLVALGAEERRVVGPPRRRRVVRGRAHRDSEE